MANAPNTPYDDLLNKILVNDTYIKVILTVLIAKNIVTADDIERIIKTGVVSDNEP